MRDPAERVSRATEGLGDRSHERGPIDSHSGTDAHLRWIASTLREEHPPWPFGLGAIEIDCLVETAQAEGVVGLLAERLIKRPDAGCVPPALLDILRRREHRDASLELFRESEYRRLLETLGTAGLQPVVIKGTALAYSLYRQPHRRSRCDLDVVFRNRAAAISAVDLLTDSGYRRPNAVDGDWITQAITIVRHDALGIAHSLDLHWSPLNQPALAARLGFAEIAAAAQALPSLGPHARIPAPPHALLIACLHRIANIRTGRANRLIWLYDIHLLAETLEQDQWRSIEKLARARGIAGLLLDGLQAARVHLHTSIPEETLATLRRAAATQWLSPAGFADERSALLSDLRALPGWRAPLQLLREHLFPPADYMRIKYAGIDHPLPLLYLRRILNRLRAASAARTERPTRPSRSTL
ncbi:nucleotidyltransferase family protein [Thiocapsa marina]|uniref:Nucleotidyltransferase family protein n=1 Tax=Thiocapsa marina 5811 TaxID=768671 RepID=F9UDK9_9GAMM|nr:nucleotidyltransferase family protein [Thiocapsa marina]EGV17953.1 hypothetical protein ThimaDRAFT_3012 [Thiocapsa marina 5811]